MFEDTSRYWEHPKNVHSYRPDSYSMKNNRWWSETSLPKRKSVIDIHFRASQKRRTELFLCLRIMHTKSDWVEIDISRNKEWKRFVTRSVIEYLEIAFLARECRDWASGAFRTMIGVGLGFGHRKTSHGVAYGDPKSHRKRRKSRNSKSHFWHSWASLKSGFSTLWRMNHAIWVVTVTGIEKSPRWA